MPVGTGTSLLENEQKKNELEPKIIKLNISNNQLIAELDLKKKAFKGNEENLNNCNAAT